MRMVDDVGEGDMIKQKASGFRIRDSEDDESDLRSQLKAPTVHDASKSSSPDAERVGELHRDRKKRPGYRKILSVTIQ
jgi:hypothetical protein